MKPLITMLGIVGVLVTSAPAAAQDAATSGEVTSAPDVGVEAELDADVEASLEPPLEADLDEAEPQVDRLPGNEEGDPEPEVSVGESAPAPDPEPQPSDVGPEEAPRPSGPALTFANSFFSWTNAVTAHTFAPGAQLTYDPTYVMNFSVTPRFYLTDTTFLWANQAMSLELTDSNGGTYNREPLLGDTLLDLRQIVAWEGFVFQGQARLGFPVSKASQAAGRIMQTGLGLTIARPIPEAAGFTIAATFNYRRWWATRNVAEATESYPGQCTQPSPGEAPVCTQASGLTTARDVLIGGLTMNVAPFAGFSVSFSGFMLGTYNHEVGATDIDVNGGQVRLEDDSPTHWRAFTYFSLAVAYDVTPWLNLQLGVQNSGVVAPLFDTSGNVRSPFSPDTQVFLTTTIGLDSLVGEIVGGGEDDGLSPEERQRRRQGLASTGRRSAF